MSDKPSVLFVCVKNGGKSQMAAGLMRHTAGDAVEVSCAGTEPGNKVNALSAESLLELGIDITDQQTRQLTDGMISATDRVVVLGRDAQVETVGGTRSRCGTPTNPQNEASKEWNGCGWSATTSLPASKLSPPNCWKQITLASKPSIPPPWPQRNGGVAARLGFDGEYLMQLNLVAFEAQSGRGHIKAPHLRGSLTDLRHAGIPIGLEVGAPVAKRQTVVLAKVLGVSDFETDVLHVGDDAA